MGDRKIRREDNYALRLQSLPDAELQYRLAQYESVDPYQKLIEVTDRICEYCNTYQPHIHWRQQIETIKIRLSAYQHFPIEVPTIISQLSDKLINLNSNPVSVILTPQLREQMILCVLSIYNLGFANRVENFLDISRLRLLQNEVNRRKNLLNRGIYINRCAEIIGHPQAMEMIEEEIIKLVHIRNYRQMQCTRCRGEIEFDRIYTNKEGKKVYLNINSHCFVYTGINIKYFQYPEHTDQAFSLDNPIPPYCTCEKFFLR